MTGVGQRRTHRARQVMAPKPTHAQPRLADHNADRPTRRQYYALLAAVFLAAVVMGAPALRGGFLRGDDIQLVRDHVLVNRPSMQHAVELFRHVHRDLYQPVALLSFSLDFAVLRALGLTPDVGRCTSGAWVPHLTNILLHAANAVLVCLWLRRITGRMPVAIVAAMIFALHPLGVETVAWLNGRMMLLSTLFAMAALIVMDGWQDRPGWWRAVLVLLLVALCMMSKVRIALPVLMLVPGLLGGRKRARHWWAVWLGVVVLTAVFVWVNVQASSDEISRGEQQLTGPRVARTITALGWYWSRLVVPVGLSPVHPAAPTVSWFDPQLPAALVVVVLVVAVVLWSARKTRIGWVGMLWFLASIAVTLPLLPSRNIAVAERYAYLPNIGLYWIMAEILWWVASRRAGTCLPVLSTGGQAASGTQGASGTRGARGTPAASGTLRAVAAGVAVSTALAVGMLATSWRVSRYYRNDVSHSGRLVSLYPDVAELAASYAWALYHADPPRYAEAIDVARNALKQHGGEIAGDAYQVIGMSLYRRGDVDGALETLLRAVAADEADGLAHERLGVIYEDTGRLEEALASYQRCAELLPNYNPGLIRLGRLYDRRGRSAEAVDAFERALANNAYDAQATLDIAEIEIEQGRYESALRRLRALLDWMPDNVAARTNVGLCLAASGNTDAARAMYEAVVRLDPDAKVAVINLAHLQVTAGHLEGALSTLEAYLGRHANDAQAADAQGWYAWTALLADRGELADEQASRALQFDASTPPARIVRTVTALRADRPDDAIRSIEGLIADRLLADATLFDALTAALQSYSLAHDADPWPYYVLAQICNATGRHQAAHGAAQAFKRRTDAPRLHHRIDRLLGD